MFITRHQEVAQSVAKLRAFGVDRSYGERTIPGIYDVPILGLNYRMSEMQAALGRVQLGRVKEILARRRVNFDTLKKGLFGIPGLTILDSQLPEAQNSHYCLSLVLDRAGREQRDAVVARLNAAGVGTSIYYRVRDPAVFELLDVARKIFNSHLIDTRLTLEQMEEEKDTYV